MSGLDFGITGKKAIVCASSKGLGFGCANALAAVGVNLVMCARDAFRRIANAASSSGLLFALTNHFSVYARSTKRLFASRAAFM